MKKVLALLLAMPLLLVGCASATETPTSTEPEVIAEAFLQASSNGDIDTCLGLLSDDVLFRQEPPGIKIEGKAEFEVILRDNMAWYHQHSLTSPLSINGDKVTCSAKVSGDDFRIIGIEHINVSYEFLICDGKIYSIMAVPSSEDWAKIIELTSGLVGIKIAVVEQGIIVEDFAENSPAEEAGVRLGDVITAVDKVSYSQMIKGEIQLRIRGPVGSKVLLTIIRKGMTDPIDIEVTRVDVGQLHFK